MKIRLTADVSGSRNGVPWPARGGLIELPDDEAARMCQNGMAVPVDSSSDDLETAMADDDSSRRGLTTNSGAATIPHQQDASGALIPVKDNAGAQDGDGQSNQTDAGDKATASAPAARKTAAAKKAAAKPPTSGE